MKKITHMNKEVKAEMKWGHLPDNYINAENAKMDISS